MKTRKEAPVNYWFDGSNWRLIGYAHDYTA